jgi:hypothetical protein
MSEDGGERKENFWMQLLKALGIFAAIVVLLVVVAFGLLVGFCALQR